MLSQIEKCVVYAKQHKLNLVLDTNTTLYGEPLSKYVRFHSPGLGINVSEHSPAMALRWKDLRVYPPALQGMVHNYTLCAGEYNPYTGHQEWNPVPGANLRLDFSRAYPGYDIVVHDAGGGGLAKVLLPHIRFTSLIREALTARLAKLPRRYEAVHIRNTDRATDLKVFLPYARRAVKGTFFLATDDAKSLEVFRKEFRRRVVTFSHVPPVLRNLHRNVSDTFPIHVRNSEAILDLLCLAHASKLHVSQPRSGYARLARYLQQEPAVVLKMLS